MSYGSLLSRLRALPEDRRRMLVVRSMPFGDIIEDDTRKVHGTITKIDGGPERIIERADGSAAWYAAGGDWQFVAYGLCCAAKGDVDYERALKDFL